MNLKFVRYFNFIYLLSFIALILSFFLVQDYWDKRIIYLILFYLILVAVFIKNLTKKYDNFPLLDLRIFSTAIIFIYIVIPLLGWVISGFELNILSDNRLKHYKLNSEDIINFHYKFYIPFFLGLLISLFLFGNKNLTISNKIEIKSPNALLIATLICLSFLEFYFISISFFADTLPTLLMQFKNIFGHFRMVCYFVFILLLFNNWDNKLLRFIFIIYLTVLFFEVFNGLISRTYFFKIILASFLLYHVLVKPFKLFHLSILSLLLLLVAFFSGAINNNLSEFLSSAKLIGVASNEWWSVFGTAYEIKQLNENGFYNFTSKIKIYDIPNYILYNDFYYLVPQQLITKVDPSLWYLDYVEGLAGLSKFGVGFTWGAFATLALWNSYFYSALYGFLTGLIISLMHILYCKKGNNLFILLIYLSACIYVYGIVRVGLGYFVYEIIYRTIPILIILALLTNIIIMLIKSKKRSKE